MKLSPTLKYIISFTVVFLAALIGSLATGPAITTWYADLQKPFFNPPNWLFGPAWTLLYTLMAIALGMVWSRGEDNTQTKKALGIFGVQLVLNALWSVVFFGMEAPLAAIFVIVALWGMILWTILVFRKIVPVTVWLLVPYLMWVTFASALNIGIWYLN